MEDALLRTSRLISSVHPFYETMQAKGSDIPSQHVLSRSWDGLRFHSLIAVKASFLPLSFGSVGDE